MKIAVLGCGILGTKIAGKTGSVIGGFPCTVRHFTVLSEVLAFICLSVFLGMGILPTIFVSRYLNCF